MKKFLITASILTFIGVQTGEAIARRAAVVFTAEMTPTCAPWDGSAMSVKIDLKHTQEKVYLMLWREGLQDFHQGKKVNLVDEDGSMDGPGYARFCAKGAESKNCTYVKASITMPKRGELGTGLLELPVPNQDGRSMYYPLEPQWNASSDAFCG